MTNDLPYDNEIRRVIAKENRARGIELSREDSEDLLQDCRLAVLEAAAKRGSKMNPAIAKGAARNAWADFIGSRIKQTTPILYSRGRRVRGEDGAPARGYVVSGDMPVHDEDGEPAALHNVDPAFADDTLSPERLASSREVREILAGVAEGFKEKRREMAKAMLDEPEFSVAAFADRHGWPRRTGYNHYTAIRKAFAAALKK